jgi:hypothetical protein
MDHLSVMYDTQSGITIGNALNLHPILNINKKNNWLNAVLSSMF